MADAADSKSVGRKAVWVRLPPPAPSLFQLLPGLQAHSLWRAGAFLTNHPLPDLNHAVLEYSSPSCI